MAESEEELKNLVMGVKEESEKASLKLSIQKTKIMASGPIISWETWKQWQILFPWGPIISWETWKQWQILFPWGPKSLWTVTATMKFKDAYSLEGKLW